MDTQTPEGYAAQRQQEINGTGFASPNATPWPAQQAAQRQQQAAAAAAAAKVDTANKTRHAWSPAKNPYLKKGK